MNECYPFGLSLVAAMLGIAWLIAPRSACPYCGASPGEQRRITADIRRCSSCNGRYPELG